MVRRIIQPIFLLEQLSINYFKEFSAIIHRINVESPFFVVPVLAGVFAFQTPPPQTFANQNRKKDAYLYIRHIFQNTN